MVLAGLELFEPMVVVVVGPDFALAAKNSWGVDPVLMGAGPMMVGTEPGEVLVPMDSNSPGAALEIVLGLLASKVVELGLEFVMEAMH